jgi:Zn-dependent protease with chaperone function
VQPVISRKEKSERWLLACMGAGALLLWYAAVAGPAAAVVTFGMVWYGAPASWIAVAAGGVLLFFAWLATPSPELDGRVVNASEAPALFETIERLRLSIDAPPIQRVLLTDELNAGAYQSGPLGLPWPMRQTLILGIPLLAVLRPQEAAAVIAHELGHFSRRHGVFGHWVYRTRLMWLALAHPAHPDDSPFERAVQWFASNFAPWFGRRAFGLSRQCEYEADRDAASAGAARDLVQALVSIDVAARRMTQWPQRAEYQALRHLPEAPNDPWSVMLYGVSSTAFQASELEATRQRAAAVDDTHPALAERAAALIVSWHDLQDQFPGGSESAGSVWLGPRWMRELSAMNTAWQALRQSEWRADCIHLRRLARQLAVLESSNAPWTRRIRYLHAVDRDADVLRLAQEVGVLDEALPLGPSFLALRARLDAGDELAAPAMRALITRDTAIALPARDALLAYATARADKSEIEKNKALLERAYKRRIQASTLVHSVIERGELRAPRLIDEALSAFDEQCAADPALRRAWSGACDVSIGEGHAFSAEVFVLQIDPDLMRAAGDDEDQLRDRYRRQLQRWVDGPYVLSVIRTCFTTEAGLPTILDSSTARGWQRAQSG